MCLGHQVGDLVTDHHPACTGHKLPGLAHPINSVIGLVEVFGHRKRCRIPLGALTGSPVLIARETREAITPCTVAIKARLTEYTPKHIDISDYLVSGRSSFAAKKPMSFPRSHWPATTQHSPA